MTAQEARELTLNRIHNKNKELIDKLFIKIREQASKGYSSTVMPSELFKDPISNNYLTSLGYQIEEREGYDYYECVISW